MRNVFIALLVLTVGATSVGEQSYQVTVQPIQVRQDDGTLGPAHAAESLAVAATNKIFAQAGVVVEFLTTPYLDATDHLEIDDGEEFRHVTLTPDHGQHPDPLVLNMWLVQQLYGGTITVQGWLNSNGSAVDCHRAGHVNFLSAYVLGHNLDLPVIPNDEGEPNNLMLRAPLTCNSLADIYPDGLGCYYLNPDQIATIQASRFAVFQGLAVAPPVASGIALAQNSPNPFTAGTTIAYITTHPGHVRVRIYDLGGRRLNVLADEAQSAGAHQLRWDGTDESGAPALSGVYLCELVAAGHRETRRMVLIR